MRSLLIFFLVIGVSIFACQTTNITTSDLPVTNVRPTVEPVIDSTPIVETAKSKNTLELSEEDEVDHGGFSIKNSVLGLSIEKAGKRLLFLKNEGGDIGGPAGQFGFQAFLGTTEKQLVYNTWTGGNHCCSYFTIVDLSENTPKIIFHGPDYDVQHNGEIEDPLGAQDIDGDGIKEIVQSWRPYRFDECAEVSQPIIDTFFKYDKTAKRYLPMKEIAPVESKWIEKMKKEVTVMNDKIRRGENPEDGSCGYRITVVGITLNYIFTGKEKEGYDYLKANYMNFDRERENPEKAVYNGRETAETIKFYEKAIRKQLKDNKLYKYLYRR